MRFHVYYYLVGIAGKTGQLETVYRLLHEVLLANKKADQAGKVLLANKKADQA